LSNVRLSFYRNNSAQAAKGLVLAYRQQVEEVRQAEMIKAQQMLAQGLSPHEVLERLTRNLTNKLMHTPCVQLKRSRRD
jgi:glutamyl-tRNA reductase